MTAGEEAVRAANAASNTIAQQTLTEESRLLLAAMLRDEMREAVAEGIKAALTPENIELVWAKGIEVARKQAAAHTGRFVLSGLALVAKKLMWAALIVLGIYSVLGWAGVKLAWKVVTATDA